jgi:hypothetical protein
VNQVVHRTLWVENCIGLHMPLRHSREGANRYPQFDAPVFLPSPACGRGAGERVFARAKRLFICIACSNYLGVSFNVFVALPLPQPLSRKAGEGSQTCG